MADFLDRYGEQLRRARQRRRRRTVRASMLAVAAPVAAALVIFSLPEPDVERPAVPQQAPISTPTPTPTPTSPPATGTWTPPVGRPEKGLEASIDRTPVSPVVTDVLAVLRRPQTERDRRVGKPRLRSFGGGGGGDGIQVEGVRALSANAVLVPVQQFGARGGKGAGLCIAGSGAVGCAPIETVPKHGVSFVSAGAKETRYAGVVPDGVVTVRFTPTGGSPVETLVRENFYDLRVPTTGPPERIPPPPGWKGRTGEDGKVEAPPMPTQGRLEWLDANGNVVPGAR
jgi:hypothetical protein